MAIEPVMLYDHLILCHLLLLLSSIFPSNSGSFPKSWLFPSGGQSVWASASASVLPLNIQSWFSLGLTGLISLQSKGLSWVFSSTIWKHQSFGALPSLWSNSHIHTSTGKIKALTLRTFVSKVMSLLFNTLLGLSYLSFQAASFCVTGNERSGRLGDLARIRVYEVRT